MTLATAHGLADILANLREYLSDDPPNLSLPPIVYRSPELWELERERIFNRSWMLVAHADQLSSTGDYVALSIAGEPIVVVRAEDGELHALSPVCRHRLMPLVDPGAGRAEAFKCRYHLWRYGLDGRLRGAPYMGGSKGFDPATCRLPAFAVEQWNGFVWVNLDSAAESIGKHLDLVAPEFTNYRLGELVQVDSWSMEWRANWKIVMENGHENYHVLGLHPDTLGGFLPGGGDVSVEQYTPWVLHARFPFAEPMEPEVLELNDAQKANGMAMLEFPCGVFIGLLDQVVWLSFIPVAIDRVHVVGGILVPPEMADVSASDGRVQEAVTAMVNDEDRMGVELVQSCVGSRYAERGHLSPKERPGLIAFYRNLVRALDNTGERWPGSL